ncbi:MAG: spore coat protein [Bacilli bacterium]|nr:spore coat protein [Bacilli bacterium]
MNNSISNPKTEVPKGTSINDKDYMNSLLGTLKEMVKNYAVALTEVSNETLYKEFKNMFDEYTNLQREVYEVMFRKGWYTIEVAEQQKLDNKHQILNQEFMDLQS